jgi:hypothetical protein
MEFAGEVDALHSAPRIKPPGTMLLDFMWRRSRTLGVMALVLMVAGTAIAIARPHAFVNPGLGAEWECSRTLFVVACSHSTR